MLKNRVYGRLNWLIFSAQVFCIPPVIPPGSQLRIVSTQTTYTPGQSIQYGCNNPNFVIVGFRRSLCQPDGQFNRAVPSCALLGKEIKKITFALKNFFLK